MSEVINPGYRKGESSIDLVLKALSVARDVYGIHSDSEKLDLAQQKAANENADRERLASGKLTQPELLDLGTKGMVAAKKGDAGAFEYTDAGTGVTGWLAKQQKTEKEPYINVGPGHSLIGKDPATGEMKPVYTAPAKTGGGGGGKVPTRMINGILHEYDAETGSWAPAEIAEQAPASYEQRLKGLKTDARNRFDSASMGLNAVDEMKAALGSGDNTFSLAGDNRYTKAALKFEEAIGRMQSGGAISKDEGKRFREMAPTWRDSAAMQKEKLGDLETEMGLRLKTLGFEPDEVRGSRATIAGGGGQLSGPSGNDPNADGKGNVHGIRTPGAPFPRTVTNAKGQTATVANEAELKEAQASGFK